MSVAGDTAWVGKKPPKRLGGMAEALSIAADLGFSITPPIPVTILSLVFSSICILYARACPSSQIQELGLVSF